MAVEAEAVAAKQIAAHHRRPPVPSDLLMPVMAGVLAGARRNQFSTFYAPTEPWHQALPLP